MGCDKQMVYAWECCRRGLTERIDTAIDID